MALPSWLAVGTLAFGLGAGWMIRGHSNAARPESAKPFSVASPAAPYPIARVAVDLNAVKADLRELLKQELKGTCPPSESKVGAEPAPPTDESTAARQKSQALVLTAIASHRWTRDQGVQLRTLMARMTDPQRKETLAELLPAINRQDVKLESPGSPLF